MAAIFQAIFLLVVCGLAQCNAACNVLCTTDYFSMLNCSISASEGPVECDVEAHCSDEIETVQGNCSIRPPSQWCIMKPEYFYRIAEHDTICTLKAKQAGLQPGMEESSLSKVNLDAIIKPRQPFNLTLTKDNRSEDFILSWHMPGAVVGYPLDDELMYLVCLKPKDAQYKDFCNITFKVRENRKALQIECNLLLPGQTYVASIQASVNSQNFPSSQWSEWSIGSELTCPNTDSPDLTGATGYLALLCMLIPLPFVLLFFFGKQGWLKKPGMFQYIPSPQDFFKPLYHTYQGDFKKWVGPVLTINTFDMLEKSGPLQVLSEKQLAALPLQRELLQESGNGGSSLGNCSLLSLFNPSSSKLYFFGDSSLGTTRSSGHISMDTVTVSGQEGTMSNGIVISDRNRPNLGILRAPGVSDEDDVLGHDGRDGLDEQGFDIVDNIEEISLDSYSSNEHSDDGYPQVGLDLDTIDSGFLESECSSPMSSECDGSEQMDAALSSGEIGSHSNYVKQWVVFTPVSEDNITTSEQ